MNPFRKMKLSSPSQPYRGAKRLPRRPARKVRLFCEPLETRLVPSTINWDGGGDGTTWTDANNWNPNSVPGATDDAVIGAAFSGSTIKVGANVTINSVSCQGTLQIDSGTFSVAAASSASKFTFNGGTLTGNGDFAISTTLNWAGGTMAASTGKTVLSGGGTGTILGGTNKFLDRTLENSGSITYNGSNFFFSLNGGDAGVINNLAGAVFNASGDGDMTQFNASSVDAFNNSGTFNRSGSGETDLQAAFNNTGSANVTAGILDVFAGGTSTGSFAVSGSTTLIFGGGSHTLSAASSVTGAGTVQLSAGTTTINGTFAVPALQVGPSSNTIANLNSNASLTSLDFNAGSLGGTGVLTVTGTLSWSGGQMYNSSGKVALAASATGTISGGTNKWLDRTLDNSGNLTYNGSNFFFNLASGVPGVINNLAGAVFNASGAGGMTQYNGSSVDAINNAGTFNRSGSGSTDVQAAFNNTGTVNITAGILYLGGGGTDTGSFAVSAGASLNFYAGTHTFNSGASVSGSGLFYLSNNNTVLTLNNSFSFPNFEQDNGTLNGSGTLTVTNTWNWQGGSMAASPGKVAVAATATGTIFGGTGKFLDRTLDNSGVINYTGSNLNFSFVTGDAGVVNNLAGATFNASGEGDILYWNSSAVDAFNNFGTFNRSVPFTQTDMNIPVFNSGSVNVPSGTLNLAGGGTDTGSFVVSSGATLGFGGGTHTLALSSSITGAGTVVFSAGTTTENGTLSVPTLQISGGTAVLNTNTSPTTLSMDSGTLSGSGIETVSGTLTWSGGTMAASTGKVSLTAPAVGTISGTSNKFLDRTLDNAGTVNYTGSAFYFSLNTNDPGVFNNLSSATFNAAGDGDLFPWNSSTADAFNNAGTFRKTAGVDVTEVNVPFNLTGVVDVPTGTFNVSGGGSAGGGFAITSGSLTLVGGTFTIQNGAAGTGGGFVILAGGTVTVNSGDSGSVAKLSQRRGTVNGGGTLTVTGTYTWGGGVESGTGKTVIAVGATGTLSGSNAKFLSRTLQNQGTLNYTGSGLTFGIGNATGTLNNQSAMTVSGSGNFSFQAGSGHLISNSGTFTRTGSGATTIDSGIAFTNSGTVTVSSGGTLTANGGYTQSAGTTTLSGSTLGGAVVLNGGALNGTGTISGSLTNGGTVNPGGTGTAGTLSVTGAYTQTAAGVLNIELGGTATGSYDRLLVGALASLAGTLNISLINSYTLTSGDTFQILTYASHSGTFGTINGLVQGGKTLVPAYNATDMTLTTT
jgi:hypothetical protein